MFFNRNNKNFYFNSTEETSYIDFGNQLSKLIRENFQSDFDAIVILCIGTDKCVGDSLGPLIGNMLKDQFESCRKFGISSYMEYAQIKIYGTLSSPVHARNLKLTIDFIYDSFNNPFVIAIDASLGMEDHIGFATVKKGPLKPGAGVKKHLPAVGDVCITGIVNRTSSKNEAVLFNSTRLSTVLFLAKYISSAICYSLEDFMRTAAYY